MHLKNVFSYYRMCSLTIALCVATRHTLNRHTRARCICFLIFSFFVSLLRRRTRDMRDLSSLFFFFSFFSFSESLLRRHTGTTLEVQLTALCCLSSWIWFHFFFPSHFSISFFSWYSQRLCSLALCWLVFCALFFLSISFFHLIFLSHFLVVLTCFVCSLALCWLVFCALQLSSYIKYSRRCSWSWTKRLS